jgi:hypothetical protein
VVCFCDPDGVLKAGLEEDLLSVGGSGRCGEGEEEAEVESTHG